MVIQQLEMINFLNQAFYLDKKAKALEAVQKRNKEDIYSGTANYKNDGGCSSTKANTQEQKIHTAIDNNKKLDKKIEDAKIQLSEKKNEIFDLIFSLNNDEFETILLWKYMDYRTFGEIASSIGYSKKTVQRKHYQAIEKLSPNVL